MPTEDELFAAVEALLAGEPEMPEPAERARLREAAGVTQARLAQVLQTTTQTVKNWEAGRAEPRPPRRQAYRRLLDGWAERFPADPGSATPVPFTGRTTPAETQTLSTGQAPQRAAIVEDTQSRVAAVPAPAAASRPARTARTSSTSRRPGAKKAAPASTPVGGADPRFENGPLAVVDVEDHQVLAYCTGGLVLDVPAKSIQALVDWTLKEAKLGQPKLSGPGKDADPLLVLTEAACEHYGLPAALTDEERLAGRLPEDHKVIKQLARADWKLTGRGFGPWARIYRPAQGAQRNCVQLCIPSWNALDTRHWADAAQLPPAELAQLLGTYASRVMTPRGSTAVTGLELMTAFHPPTRASEPDENGNRHSEHNPGSLGKDPVDPAPCEVPDGHPLLSDMPRFHRRTPAEVLVEEAYDWARPLTDAECTKRFLVGIDVNMAFAAAANRLTVGLSAPVHVHRPLFDPKLPGSWLVDLSHIRLDERLPSPFTPHGERPTGPAWYATPTVAYAVELGYPVTPLEAYLRYEHGPYLDAWYTRLRDAYVATMADLGITPGMPAEQFLAAMAGHQHTDPVLAAVLSAIKATVKGGLGKLRERARSGGWRPGEPWPALARPTWRPDIRAAVIAGARINMHRKMLKLATHADLYPVAILSDCAVYAADGPSPLDFLPYRDGKPLPGTFRLGVSPGMVKHEGTQSVLWAEGLLEEHGPDVNLARHIKTGIVAGQDEGE
ncbi:telomere-associated protein Tap [Streptomyces sp. NPDC001410]|uniref:telomere-associated protein Tap n=1 Tax=Streptomyces sp. NPDC001410 TaxID=3364574 RepID=UPI00369C2BA9